jgi:hypothetical protein
MRTIQVSKNVKSTLHIPHDMKIIKHKTINNTITPHFLHLEVVVIMMMDEAIGIWANIQA